MKRNKIIVGLLMVVQLVGFSSCSDWLELYPENTISRKDYWKSKEDVASVMTGIYQSLRSCTQQLLIWGEFRADMLIPGTTILVNWDDMRRGEYAATNSLFAWGTLYTCINNCNMLIDYAPMAYENDNSFTEAELHEYQGQAIAIRSLLYFYLVRSFRDVPMTLNAYADNSQYLMLAKSTDTEILDQLVTDLNQVINDGWIPANYSYTDVAQNKGYITRYAAQTLLADIYLWQEQYELCNQVCDQVLKSGQYALLPIAQGFVETLEGDTVYYAEPAGVSEYYYNMYVEGNCVESIFEIQYDRENTNPFFSVFCSANCWAKPNTEHLVDFFTPTLREGLERTVVDMRENVASRFGSVWKWAGMSYDDGTVRSTEDMDNNFIIYRLAQVYLMKAEALAQMGIAAGEDAKTTPEEQTCYQEAYALCQALRTRAGATETTDLETNNGLINGKSLEEFILLEEAREFLYEGKRWYDVVRNAKRKDYTTNIGYLLNTVPYSVIADKSYSMQTKYKKSPYSWYFPCPQADIENNSLLEQNPFYAGSGEY